MYKVLIVDDERMIREGMKKVIPWNQLEIEDVRTAASGFEALDLMKQEWFDIMITDISMTEMTGLELIEKSEKIFPDLRVLVSTGYDSFEYARQCLRLKVQDFLLKPINEDILLESIQKQVEYLKNQKKLKIREQAERRTVGIADQVKLEKILKDMIHNRNQEKNMQLLKQQFQYEESMLLMAAVMVPELEFGMQHQDNLLKLRQIQNVCLSVIDVREFGITILDDESDKLLIILFTEKCGSNGAKVISEVNGILKDEFGRIPRVAIGNEVTGFHQLYTSYQEAIYLLENEKDDMTKVLQAKHTLNRTLIFCEVYEEFLQEMTENISDYSYVMRVFEAFSTAAESYNLSKNSVQKCCFEIVSKLYFTYITSGSGHPSQTLESFLDSLNGTSILECKELSRQYLSKMLSTEENDVHEIVGKAKHYINQHLSENLSVASIAELLYVSPNYFSRLFKRVTEKGCNEYIVYKRIEKACNLLETTNFNNRQIAAMVGYNDTNYFSMAFKKHCGMTPTHYRNQMRNLN